MAKAAKLQRIDFNSSNLILDCKAQARLPNLR